MSSFRRIQGLYLPTTPRIVGVNGRRLNGLPSDMKVMVFNTEREAGVALAQHLSARVDDAAMRRETINVGLAAGESPRIAYETLRGKNWSHVRAYGLDEYFPMRGDDPKSFQSDVRKHLLNRVKIDPGNIHFPNADPSEIDPHVESRRYEKEIRDAGDIDVQLLGKGRLGHLGLNERGSPFDSLTRLVDLFPETFEDAKEKFVGRKQPTQGITMGLGTIMRAWEILFIVTGDRKAESLARAVLDPPTPNVPASVLQTHGNVWVFLDRLAASVIERRLARRS